MSSLHVPPEIWGPLFWSVFHIVSMGYPDNPTYAEKRAAKEFYSSFIYLLPCPECRVHFQAIYQVMPVETWLDNRAALMEWVWMLHNRVNERLKKPTLSMTEFHARYREMAEIGLPIPPSNPRAEVAELTATNAWIRGAVTTLGTLAVAGAVGGLLWASYSGSGLWRK